jgi:thiol-disulfide isomerase/thioredoxin
MYLVTVFTTLLCSAIGVTSSPLAVAQQPNAIDPQAIKLEHLDQAKLERLICSRKGRALFINVWATWCAPCVEEFPDIVKLAEDLRDQPIDFIAVSGDDFDKAQSTVIPFLMKHKVRLTKIGGVAYQRPLRLTNEVTDKHIFLENRVFRI